MDSDGPTIPSWVYAVFSICCYLLTLPVTSKNSKVENGYPFPRLLSNLIPAFVLNILFALRPISTLQYGYKKFQSAPFQVVRTGTSIVVLPMSLLDELVGLPPTVASPHAALENDLLGPFTGLDLILESRLHHTIVQRKLTPRLKLLTPSLENELNATLIDFFPVCDGWTEFMPYQILGKVSARLAGRALVGSEICRDPVWLDISVNFTESLFRTIVILRFFPSWLHPALSRLLPSYWAGKRYIKSAKSLLGPKISQLLRENQEKGEGSSTHDMNRMDVLHWLVEAARGRDRTPDTLAHVQVLLALAAVHTTLLRMVNVLYDLTANPLIIDALQSEIEAVHEVDRSWSDGPYLKLQKLDSVVRESQRMSPPTTLGLKRLFKESHIFANGLYVEKGTFVCLPTYAIENDPANTKDPEIFDGLRSFKLRQSLQETEPDPKGQTSSHEDIYGFSSVQKTVLNFGYGKSACPGRFFASLIIKMVFTKLLTEYDFQFIDGAQRPKSLTVHEFLFCWPWERMLVKRKQGSFCPFSSIR